MYISVKVDISLIGPFPGVKNRPEAERGISGGMEREGEGDARADVEGVVLGH